MSGAGAIGLVPGISVRSARWNQPDYVRDFYSLISENGSFCDRSIARKEIFKKSSYTVAAFLVIAIRWRAHENIAVGVGFNAFRSFDQVVIAADFLPTFK
jgi:hypothetical protein